MFLVFLAYYGRGLSGMGVCRVAKGKESYKKGAMMLMAAGLVVRLLGFVNRIYLSNLIGAEGMGLYQLTSPVYGLIILTLTAGVSITVSSMTAQEKARGRVANARRVAKTGFAFLLGIGLFMGILLALFSGVISKYWLQDERTRLTLVLLAPCIPLVASASAIKGYFYGCARVTPTAVSQIVEQMVRIAVIFALAGPIARYDLAAACALATVSSALGEMANLGVVAIAFYKECRTPALPAPTISRRTAALAIGKFSFPISLNRFLISVMGSVEAVLLPARFVAGGLDYASSIAMLGRLSGMAMPLISFPTLVTSSLATTLVPAIAESVSTKNYRLANSRISRCIRMSLLMGFFFFGFFRTFGEAVGKAFYPGEAVGGILQELAACCILLYLQQTMNGILNGLGRQGVLLFGTTLGYVLRFVIFWFAVPVYGIHGTIWGNLCSMALTSLYYLVVIMRQTKMPFQVREWVVKPFFPGLAVMTVGTFALELLQDFGSYAWLGAAAISCILALGVMVLLGLVRPGQVKELLGKV